MGQNQVRVRGKVVVAVVGVVSVAVAVIWMVPVAQGLPVMRPVVVSRVSPQGSPVAV